MLSEEYESVVLLDCSSSQLSSSDRLILEGEDSDGYLFSGVSVSIKLSSRVSPNGLSCSSFSVISVEIDSVKTCVFWVAVDVPKNMIEEDDNQ